MITIEESYEKTYHDTNYYGKSETIIRKVTTYYLLGIPLLRCRRFQTAC